MNDKTFVKITNQSIYDKLLEIEKHVIKTNGRTLVNRWIATTALTLAIGTIPLVVYALRG